MNVLEKILEEIKEAAIKVSTVKEHTYFKAVGTRKIEENIRSHMDDDSDGWIPVEERLPEDKGDITKDFDSFMESRYLITDGLGVVISVFCDGCFKSPDDCIPYRDVIAWMPLPEPYKPSEPKLVKNTRQELEDFWTDK